MGALARIVCAVCAGLTLAASPPAADPPPVASGAGTTVEVRLVTIDVVALDRRDRALADMSKDDFRLFVDGKETPIDTLDRYCDGGGGADPVAKQIGGWATPADLGEGTRRVVLAFDYLHLPTVPCPGYDLPCHYDTQSLQQYQ